MLLRGAQRLGRLFRPAPAGLITDPSPAERRGADRIPVERTAVLRWQESSRESELAVRVFDRSPEGVGLWLPEELPVGLLANVRWEGGHPIQTVVRHCRQRDSQYIVGLMHLPVQRRTEDRQPRNEPSALVWDDLLAGRVSSPVHLIDFSLSGLRCSSPRKIPVPMVTCLSTADSQYYGTTRYCVESEGRYTIGIQIVHAKLSVEPGQLLA